MRNLNEYKNRFNQLLESTIGDVKPLISEDADFEKYVTPTIDMIEHVSVGPTTGKVFNTEIKLEGNNYIIKMVDEGAFKPNEEVEVFLEFTSGSDGNKESLKFESNGEIVKYPSTERKFNMPKTQEEFDSLKPFSKSWEVPCLNVRGGKIKITLTIPDGTTIL